MAADPAAVAAITGGLTLTAGLGGQLLSQWWHARQRTAERQSERDAHRRELYARYLGIVGELRWLGMRKFRGDDSVANALESKVQEQHSMRAQFYLFATKEVRSVAADLSEAVTNLPREGTYQTWANAWRDSVEPALERLSEAMRDHIGAP